MQMVPGFDYFLSFYASKTNIIRCYLILKLIKLLHFGN